MPLLRPNPSLSRPSIRELSSFLFSPQPARRCPSRLIHHPKTTQSRKYVLSSQLSQSSTRPFSTRPPYLSAPKSHDRGPASTEDTQTDFGSLNVLGNTPPPSTSIDACLWDGFHLNSGIKIVGGSGVLLVGGEAFGWRPWEAEFLGTGEEKGDYGLGVGNGKRLLNRKGQWDVGDDAWGLLGLVWPKPDLLILGLGKEMRPLSPKTRQFVNSLGIRIDIQDTRNAAAQFNLLATERGVGSVAAALVPLGWREGLGVRSGA